MHLLVTVHRLSTEVCPIVVTKNRTALEVQEMYDLGFRHFAENRVEKLLERQEQISARGHHLAFNRATPKTKSEASHKSYRFISCD